MYAPAHVCKALARKNPDLRLAWQGLDIDPEAQNVGYFCLVRLLPTRALGHPDNPNVVEDWWDVEYVQDPKTLTFEVKRAKRGPVFAKDGGLKRDWDPLSFAPIIMQRFRGGPGMPDTNDVMSGRFLRMFQIMDHKQAEEAERQNTIEEGRALQKVIDDKIDAGVDKVWHAANQTGNTRMITARKHNDISWQKKSPLDATEWLQKKRGF